MSTSENIERLGVMGFCGVLAIACLGLIGFCNTGAPATAGLVMVFSISIASIFLGWRMGYVSRKQRDLLFEGIVARISPPKTSG
jgi:hypothetical protein